LAKTREAAASEAGIAASSAWANIMIMGNNNLLIKENHPLAGLTTFDTGGPARYYAAVSSDRDVVDALGFACGKRVPVFVLGGGSNLLISDDGFPGLVIHNRIKGYEVRPEGGLVRVSSGAGEDWPGFVDRCVAAGLRGIECLAGIPGTVGASPVQNIGAYGQDVSETITAVSAVETDSGNVVSLSSEECAFGYRRSLFNSAARGKYIVTAVDFGLAPGGIPALRYPELQRRFSGGCGVTLSGVRDAVKEIRNSRGLLVGEGFDTFRSAGSFFKNPVVQAEAFCDIEERVKRAGGCSGWAWPMEDGSIKISAACLIERVGFRPGHRSGSAGISPRHSLVIINYGDATSGEIAGFAAHVQEKVFEEFGLLLAPEVRLVGFSRDIIREC
jgi:UDP-N-acetylmuramate dehydrogenase